MKKVYVSFLLHGNMCYDRYTKQEIREKFPRIYATGVRAMHRFPQVTAHVDLPGLTVLSLKHHAPWLLDEMRPLIQRGQLVMVGCQYAANHALCADEESDVVAGRVSMQIQRDELGAEVTTFFPQEIAFHPQSPLIMRQMGASRLIVMPDGWTRPRRVRGIEGSEVNVYPLDLRNCRVDMLEHLYDTFEDGDFVMAGGDFEMLGNIEQWVRKMKELAGHGKVIEWMTVDRYEREVGIRDTCAAPTPFGQSPEDQVPSPSFSRWVGDPEDVIWHGHAVTAMESVRAAGFAEVAAAVHRLGSVNVPLAQAWTTPPDNAWDHRFEEVNEYPETEARYLTHDGTPTLVSRAWHQLLIGLNSDASGWFPWTPRTRHRNLALQTATALGTEVQARFAAEVARNLPRPAADAPCTLALNPAPARTVEVATETEAPMAFAGADGCPLATETLYRNGRWSARAEVALPAYGYRLLSLQPATATTPQWAPGDAVDFAGKAASLQHEVLRVSDGRVHLGVSVAPFRLSDPSGVADTEEVTPDWSEAETRVRETLFGPDLEVFTELAWAVWLRLVLGLRRDRVEVTAEVHVDMPRRIGKLHYDPEGLILCFQGAPGSVFYDVPYATIEHPNHERSFAAVQRFAALQSPAPFGVVCLGGNQSFLVAGHEGILGANLGASTQGRPDTRPQCLIREDGTGEHRITSGGDPFLGGYTHRFAVVAGGPTEVALAARRLRIPAPVFRVAPGGGTWPAERSLLEIGPETAHVTAFRRTPAGGEVSVNDVSGAPTRVCSRSDEATLPAYGFANLKV